jgi:hypothetical protein
LHWNKGRLPDDRRQLYEQVLDWLAHARKDRPGRLPPTQCLKMMRRLALGMQANPGGRRTEIPLREAAEILAPAFPEAAPQTAVEAAEDFLATEERDSGIIVGRGRSATSRIVRFWHLIFQEYLAAVELAGYEHDKRHACLFGCQNLYRPEWGEVVPLLAATLYDQGEDRVDEFFREVLDGLKPAAGGMPVALSDRVRCVGLIGIALQDLRQSGYQISDPRYWENLNQVLPIIDTRQGDPIPSKTPQAPDQVGHPRPKDEERKWVALPRNATVPPFQIGRYPVTVGEFRSFVQTGGYDDPAFWTAGGFKECLEPQDWERQQQHSNRPVVGVSWYEAAAYCVWAKCRLLTEEEWEYAFPDGRGGEAPNARAANTLSDVPRHAIPVGLDPVGATLSGVQDMAGYVQEWTGSWSDARKLYRVARGVSWYDHHKSAACARFNLPPNYRRHFLGFRYAKS